MALAFFDIESIIGSGPTMLGFGLTLLILTRSSVLPHFRWLAWVYLFFPVAIFSLIFICSWSPAEAQTPVSIIIALMTSITTIALFVSVVTYRKRFSEEEHERIVLASGEPPSVGHRQMEASLPPRSADPPNPFTTDDQSETAEPGTRERFSW